MQENVSVLAATAILNYDLLSTYEAIRRRNYPRRLVGIGCAGSAAPGDTEFEVRVNGLRIGTIRNLATGWPTKDHFIAQNIPIPANALLEFIVTDAALTNPINVVLIFVP